MNENDVKSVDTEGLPALLEELVASGVRLLTFDCFDTLIWRNTSSPYDVFVSASQYPAWSERGVTPALRVAAEAAARKARFVAYGHGEVTLIEIFQALDPTFSVFDLKELQEAEIDGEVDACQAFSPMVDLAAAARLHGIQVAIVSDTYLSPEQLREVAGSAELFDKVPLFTSSAFRMSKAEGLIGIVAKTLGVATEHVAHIGDSHAADVLGAQKVGARGILFATFDQRVVDRARAFESFVSVAMPEVRAKFPLLDTRKFALAHCGAFKSREDVIGKTVVGPMIHAFVNRILSNQIGREESQLVFLMRDGWLPMKVFEKIGYGTSESVDLHVSRFTATAASFTDQMTVEAYMLDHVMVGSRLDVPAGQLGLQMPKTFAMNEDDVARFKDVVRRRMTEVLEWSGRFQNRLATYLASKGVIGGRTTLIDLGYTGTVERRLRQCFPHVDLAAYYMISLPTVGGLDGRRGGVVGDELDDHRIAATLMKVVSPLEVWCSSGEGSVIDYTEDGTPILAPDTMPAAMRESARLVQASALEYVLAAEEAGVSPSNLEAKQIIVGLLGAVGYLPSYADLEVLQRMVLDVNLGTDHLIPMVNMNLAARQLMRRGFGYLDAVQERSMLQSAEVRAIGVELSLAWLNVMRYGVTLTRADMTHRSLTVAARVEAGGGPELVKIEARATHDGFCAADFPNAVADGTVSFLIGNWEYLQIEVALLIPFDVVATRAELNLAAGLVYALFDAEEVAKGLVKTGGQGATLTVPTEVGFVTRLVFRPCAGRP